MIYSIGFYFTLLVFSRAPWRLVSSFYVVLPRSTYYLTLVASESPLLGYWRWSRTCALHVLSTSMSACIIFQSCGRRRSAGPGARWDPCGLLFNPILSYP
ncbi:hypothetical protein FA95DRAFT_300533 [Auriscalpium vulgare]|uniref:Uncharacterized protein n=1 Tax=Auriscalpium vulgare TaxID=40419 RepID=A0ACB8RK64_9AGAM|nr:hypothetical protein FA95DRAFT_300533 [Auriscalpium vulgare]